MLIKDHVYMAYENYCHVLGEPPEVGSPFKSLHKKMAADPNGILRSLSEKLDNKEFRLGPSLSMEIATNILSATRMLPSNIPAELRTHAFFSSTMPCLLNCERSGVAMIVPAPYLAKGKNHVLTFILNAQLLEVQ